MHLKKEGKLCPADGICWNCMKGHTPECWAIEKPLLFTYVCLAVAALPSLISSFFAGDEIHGWAE